MAIVHREEFAAASIVKRRSCRREHFGPSQSPAVMSVNAQAWADKRGDQVNQIEVMSLFDYRDGGLFWRVTRGNNAKAGCRAGATMKTGYRSIHISGRRFQEHRLVFLWHHGFMPTQIDHVNGDKSDNRVENLREADYSRNQMNTRDRKSATGYRGVRFVEKTGRWSARIYQNGREIRIGTFDSPEEASAAYKAKAAELFGEFAS